MPENKSRILYIRKYLEEQTDEEHPAAISDILAHLKTVGIETSRFTVAREIEQLTEAGVDVVCNKGKPNQYFIGDRHFELPELKLLVDVVTASRFIPPKKADALIEKLSGFASVHQSGELRRSLYTDRQARPLADKAYITVDMLHTAESTGRKIICKYFEWGADKKKDYKHGRRDYSFSPYGLIWNNDRYYTVGWSDSHGKIITLRVDRIAAPKLTDEPAAPKPEGFDMAFYAETVIQMYDGPLRDITLYCENDMMKHVIDRFGEDVKTETLGAERFKAFVRVPASPTFFAWVFTFEGGIGRRVLCLYRVSTDKQVTYNEREEADIPMQRQTSRRFLEQQGWVLVHEEREDGISGHKVRAEKRDSIQYIKELAITKKFDILLVFMFDRIGRIADETPFVVEWLIKHDIRVWSVNEGEQRLDTHTDKLMNYIRFWQADGESEKTSIRTKAALGQLVEDGHYKGGNAPYGYTLVKSGRLDKKKNEKKNLAILDDEAVLVSKIFDLYVTHGLGSRRIAGELTREGIKTRSGKKFAQTSINSILKNVTYTGILRSGESRSQVIEALQIIPPHIYEKAREIMEKRNTDAADARTYPMKTNSRCLLNGKVYCMDCGSRLIVSTTARFATVDGVKLRKLRYTCYRKYVKHTDCQGQTGYSAMRLDNLVDGIVRHIFEKMQSIPKSEVITSSLMALKKEHEMRYAASLRDYTKAADDLAGLKAEVLKTIRGESEFSAGLLGELIAQTETKLTELEAVRDTAEWELNNCKHRIEEMQVKYDEVISWTELYDTADFTARKMIIANLINRIEVGTDYQLHIDLNIDLEHFNIQLDFCTYGQGETA